VRNLDRQIWYMMGIRKCIFYGLITLVMMLTFVSCHWGDPESMRPTYADKKRCVEYSLNVGFPFASSESFSIEDYDVDGLKINWNEREALAVFCKNFVMEADTLVGSASIPQVMKLSFDARRDGNAGLTGNVKTLELSFESWIKQGEGETYAENMPVLYPYSRVLDENGAAPKCDIDSLQFNFNGQDGRLEQLRDSFFIAMANGVGVVRSGVGSITTQEENLVLLKPKFAIVRIALTFPAENDYTLSQYIKMRSFSESVRYIDNITVSNENTSAPGFNKTVLDLTTGSMNASDNALPILVLRSNNAFTTLVDVPYENWISLEPIGGTKSSWGTMLYVAVPCTDGGHLDLDALIDVAVVTRADNTTEHYYGRLQPVTLSEGSYYLTSSVALKTADVALEKAEVLSVPGTAALPDND